MCENALQIDSELAFYCECRSLIGYASLRSKRFRGFRGKELPREKRGGRGRGRKETSFPSPTPSFLFWLSPQFRAGKIPFLGLSLLPNPTETLGMQAMATLVTLLL